MFFFMFCIMCFVFNVVQFIGAIHEAEFIGAIHEAEFIGAIHEV